MSELYDISKLWQDWQTVRLIGEGSFGKVYEIVRKRFGIEERCALKVITIPTYTAEIETLRNDGLDDKSVTLYYRGLVEEVVQEIALMKKLRDNNNIVRYEDFQVLEHEDTVGWDIIIRMELLKAAPLHFREISLTVSDVLHLGIDMCKALEECETHKIIHRDIKPDNIFICESGTYKLGDFGVARTIDRTMSGLSKKGTYTYMAPEVYRGEEYGATVDIYSLGIVMYKLLNNNREPFLPPYPQTIQYSDKNNALVYRMSGKEILPIPGVDERLNSVILKACAYKSEDRYRSATQLKEELQNILDALNEKESVVASGETLKTKNDETLSVFDSKRFETSVKPNVAEEKKANAEEAKPEVKNDVDVPLSKEPYIRIEQEENLEGTIGMFAKVPVPEKAPEEDSVPQLSEKKEPQKPTEDIVKEPQKTENKEIKEKKKPKWWIPLIAVLGAAVVAAIIIATVSCAGNSNDTLSNNDPAITASEEIVTSSVAADTTSVPLTTEVKAKLVVVPDVKSAKKEDAIKKLKEAGLGEPKIQLKNDDKVAAGKVISQNINANAKVEEGTEIILVVSSGPATFDMPKVTGETESNAKKVLTDKGLKVTVNYAKSDTVAEGRVIKQSISASKKVKKGDSVVITVSSGKNIITVADVTGDSKSTAVTTLENQGFEVAVYEKYSNSVGKGKVISQSPSAGSGQIKGAEITIYISKGKEPVNVSFNANGGSVSSKSKQVYLSETYGTLPTPSRNYYTFKGWYTSSSGGTKITSSTKVSSSGSHTLYAHWTANSTSGWVKASSVPSGAKIIDTKWTYRKTTTTSNWVEKNSGTHHYAALPGGFYSSNGLYGYNGSAIGNYENSTEKRVVSDSQFHSYIYWHWCRGGNHGAINRKISDGYKDEFWCFHAFETGTYVDYSSSAKAWQFRNVDACADTYWWFQVPVYRQTYTIYELSVNSTYSDHESSTEVKAGSNISNVQKWVRYQPK